MSKDCKIINLPNVSSMDLTKVCRLCAKSKNTFIHLFGKEGQKLDLSLKIHQCLQIQVCTGDTLPAAVCNDCCKKLLHSYEFFREASDVQVMLHSLCQRDISPVAVYNKSSERHTEPQSVLQKKDVYLSKIADNKACDNAAVRCVSRPSQKPVPAMRVWLATTYSWHCTDCSAILSDPKTLQKHHEHIHKQPVQYQCLQCSKVYTVYKKFARHVRLHRNKGKFKCEECLKGFSTKQALEVHMVLHSNARPFICNECGHTFRQAAALYSHQHTHAQGMFPCLNCKKILTSNKALQHHLQSHNKVYNFICEICGRGFMRKQTLHYHVMTHTGKRPFSCQTCCQTFRTQQQLRIHLVVHTGEQAYQCDICGRQFSFRSSLMSHTRIHTGEKPYICEFCDQCFRYKGVFMIHRRKHTGERPYLCAKCGWTFSCYANHAKHVKRQHCNSTRENQLQLCANIFMTSEGSGICGFPSANGLAVLAKKNCVHLTTSSLSPAYSLAATHHSMTSNIVP